MYGSEVVELIAAYREAGGRQAASFEQGRNSAFGGVCNMAYREAGGGQAAVASACCWLQCSKIE
jgi:hypothetical protein